MLKDIQEKFGTRQHALASRIGFVGDYMRHRLMIAGFVAASALCIGLVAVIQPPAPAGKFPPEFPNAERRQIVSVANRDALKQTLDALRRGRFGEARRWWLNSRKQTVRNMGQQG